MFKSWKVYSKIATKNSVNQLEYVLGKTIQTNAFLKEALQF